MRDRGQHQIFAKRRSPSWGRIALTLVGAVAIVLAGVSITAWAAGALTTPATAARASARKPAAKAVRTSTAHARTDATRTVATVKTPAPATPSIKPKSAAKPASARVRRHVSASTLAARHPPSTVASRRFVVVIDPGHQGQGDNRPDPIGPGASQTKPAVADGAQGVVTHRPESLDNLQISLKLRRQLQARGVTVIMVRTSENVDIANSARAMIANRAHAGLFVRIHCDGVSDSSVVGLLTVVPDANRWTGPIVRSSARAGRDIQSATLATTHAHNRGISPRADMSGFNWSRVPSVIVESGLMSNPAEDRRLATGAYQDKLAAGIADGIMRFAAGR